MFIHIHIYIYIEREIDIYIYIVYDYRILCSNIMYQLIVWTCALAHVAASEPVALALLAARQAPTSARPI